MATNFTSSSISAISLRDQKYHLKGLPFHGTEAEWNEISYTPKAGEIIIYDADELINYSRIKIGNGESLAKDLDFVNFDDGSDISVDTTLTQSGMAADSKTVGDWMNNIILSSNNYGSTAPEDGQEGQVFFVEDTEPTDSTLTISGAAADAKATGDAINAINLKDLSARGTTNGDFDTIFEVGIHWMQLASCTNGPTSSGFGFLNVYTSSKTETFIVQEFTMYANAGASWTRTYVNSAWTQWYSRGLQSYPVGSIYMSTSSTSPASFIGGTWEQIKDVFLLAAGDTYTAGATGGASTVKLTTANLPSHSHNPVVSGVRIGANTGELSGWQMAAHTNWSQVGTFATTSSVGSGTAHNNMPPYLAVYVWKRVS